MEIQLIFRYHYRRDQGRDGDDYRFSTWDDVHIIDTYCVDDAYYLVKTVIRDHYSFDIGDDHGCSSENVTILAFPITQSQADCQNGEQIHELVAQQEQKNHYVYRTGTIPGKPVINDRKLLDAYIADSIGPALQAIADKVCLEDAIN